MNTAGLNASLPPPQGTLCVFPFYYGKQAYTECQKANSVPGFLAEFGANLTASAVKALVNGSGFCAITSNLTADRAWGGCECRGPASGGSMVGPRPLTGAWRFGLAFNSFFVRPPTRGLTRSAAKKFKAKKK